MDANKINNLAMDQAILADANETPMDAETAVQINAASPHAEQERRLFKQDFAATCGTSLRAMRSTEPE